MTYKSWHIDRRTCLKGAGVSLALPLLESMTFGGSEAGENQLPARLCCVYFPFGVATPKKDSPQSSWGWFPQNEGREYELSKPLAPLASLRDELTILGGLSHPNGRRMGGHDTGDIFLTGASFKGAQFRNSISLDQFAAQQIGSKTRFPSLVMSSDGGVGEPTRATTLSFTPKGRPIPALASPRQIFNRLFGEDESMQSEQQRLENSASMLDLVLEHSRKLKRKLGRQDRVKLDDYLSSVRQVEQQVRQSQQWLDIPKPEVDADALALDADPQVPRDYLETMYDLIFLAFQTDSTRVATYMLGQVAGATTIANAFPACIGLKGNWHGLAHKGASDEGAENLGRFDQFLTARLARFLERLKSTPEGDGNMLDRTLVLYGSSNSRTHQNRNYPLVLAGGRSLGLTHGHYRRFGEDIPLSNLFVTLLDRMNLRVDTFADSTGEVSELRI